MDMEKMRNEIMRMVDELALEQSEKADRNLKWLMGIIISIAGIGGGSGVAIVSQALEMMP